tara:strand:- start:998 stop:2200 length:1203 start_codon:yes stop_codon:yes gene_type:complete
MVFLSVILSKLKKYFSVSEKGQAEECLLQRDDAEILARKYKRVDNKPPEKKDELLHIPCSLLSAEHIREYVEETGLISPFYIKGGKKSRLKDAAYEGRIGNFAYEYRENEKAPKRIFSEDDEFLTVPKNSIIFVECDLDFRLPEFIALRFNLQIKHVHRGLLLGTGPLVDPGYWGKLCIPLHNLTSEDYIIDKNDGLIWIEFTKTTSDVKLNEERIGRPPLDGEFWKIEDFLKKATNPVNADYARVGIRSAIPSMHDAAVSAAKNAEAAAKKSARRSQRTLWISAIAGGISALAVLISMFQLTYNYYSDISQHLKNVLPSISIVEDRLSIIESKLKASEDKADFFDKKDSHAAEELAKTLARIDELERRLKPVMAVEESSPPNSGTPKDTPDSEPIVIAE